MLDTTRINNLIVEGFHDDEIGKKLLSLNMTVVNTDKKGNPNYAYIMMDTKVKFQEDNCGHIMDSKHQLSVWQKEKEQRKCYVNNRGRMK